MLRHVFSAAAAIALVAQANAQQAASPATARPVTALTALDYIEIEQLNRKYAWAIDHCGNDGFEYADLYTPDAKHSGHDGGYEDIYVKTPQGWRYKQRIHVFPPQIPGAYSGVPNTELAKRNEAKPGSPGIR